jgi:hypothetical protein
MCRAKPKAERALTSVKHQADFFSKFFPLTTKNESKCFKECLQEQALHFFLKCLPFAEEKFCTVDPLQLH